MKVGPKLDTASILSLVANLRAYHGDNFPSILMMIAFSKLAVNLENHEYNLPSCHLIGEMATGKSRAADHMRSMLPYSVSPNGSTSVMRLDNPTESILNKLLCVSGPICIFDPPPALKEATMNKILDHAYQGVLHRTHNNSMESLKVSTGLMLVHAHEKRGMKSCNPTALSKAVIGVHERMESANHEEMSKLDQEIMSQFETNSGMFRIMVIPLEADELEENKNSFTRVLNSNLQAVFGKQTLNTNARLIQNYGLYLASLKQCLADMHLPQTVCLMLEQELLTFFSTKCIPENLRAIQISMGVKTIQIYAPENLMGEITAKLSSMDFRELFQSIWIGTRKKDPADLKGPFQRPNSKVEGSPRHVGKAIHFGKVTIQLELIS